MSIKHPEHPDPQPLDAPALAPLPLTEPGIAPQPQPVHKPTPASPNPQSAPGMPSTDPEPTTP